MFVVLSSSAEWVRSTCDKKKSKHIKEALDDDDMEPVLEHAEGTVAGRKRPKRFGKKKSKQNRSELSSDDYDVEPVLEHAEGRVAGRKRPKRCDKTKCKQNRSELISDDDDLEPVLEHAEGTVAGRKRPKRFGKKKSKHRIADYSDDQIEQETRNAAVDMVKDRRRNCPWTKEDLDILRNSFKEFFRLRRPPDFPSIAAAQSRYPQLRKRNMAQIKSRAWHIIQTGH